MKRDEIKRRPLSDTALASLEPEAAEYREHDGSGLYFRVKPNGRKSWVLRYKAPSGKWNWTGLGSYPEVTGAMARQQAKDLRKEAGPGADLAAVSRARQRALQEAGQNTFEKIAEEWYSTRLAGWTEGTAKRVLGALKIHVFPKMGRRPLTDIQPMEWLELLRGLEQRQIFEQMGSCQLKTLKYRMA